MSTNESHYMNVEIQKELRDIYAQYHNSIKIFITQLESLQNKFPVEILNEIRAVFSHIAKIYMCKRKDIALENIVKAKGHMKRAQLDAYKYMCYAYLQYYNNFKDLYCNVNLSHVNNGDFVLQLGKLYSASIAKTAKAKEIENTAEDSASSYEAYEEAYCTYTELYKLINDNLQHIVRLQQNENTEKEELNKKFIKINDDNEKLMSEIEKLNIDNKREKIKSTIFTVISVILAITSVVLGFIALG